MSAQLESRHFFRRGDRVEDRAGRTGEVVDAVSLFARIRWDGGPEEEVEQFDRTVLVVQRAEAG
jgi:hypothetical protein